MSLHRTRVAMLVALVLASIAATKAGAKDPNPAVNAAPQWIWSEKVGDDQTVYLRKTFELPAGVTSAKILASCDNMMTVYVDGKQVMLGEDWNSPSFADAIEAIRRGGTGGRAGAGRHVLAVRATNSGGPAGLIARVEFEGRRTAPPSIISDGSWRVSEKPEAHWNEANFDDASWAKAVVKAPLGGGPWTAVNAKSFSIAAHLKAPTATAPETLSVAKGFTVDLLYTVPKDSQGSWVSMTVDPKGRLIVSDQYGKLYRVTPQPVGAGPDAKIEVEPINVEIGEAQGLLWAFDSLYVVVNAGRKYKSGLYRVRDTDGDGELDKVELLRAINGGGEHGPHGVVLSHDGKALHVVAGNATQLTELAGSLVPRIWGEDSLLPWLTDGNGFMANERAPGGCVYRVSPDGKEWTLVSMGYRNQYDLALNREGDIFTYDSDMEWDVNTPWYRPTRVCMAASGSDLGYRNGSEKMPTYYIDSIPPVVNIGPGSPTGVTFAYDTKWPAPYRDALYVCDWSYGKLYAVHLRPKGGGYVGEAEEFINGHPLPLTDIVVNPVDGHMYFAIGGRLTLSGLYRVRPNGKPAEPAAKPESLAGTPEDAGLRALRRKLESFHGHASPEAVDVAWPSLGHPDRLIRYAARVAIEFQDPASWRDRALAEKNPRAGLTALLALVRVSADDPYHLTPGRPSPDPALRGRIVAALDQFGWDSLDESLKLDLLRVYEVLLNRMGRPDGATATHLIDRLAPHYPSSHRALNSELCQLLVFLGEPDVAAKTVELMERAPTQEEQLDYAKALRVLKTGWTPDLRKRFFAWFLKAANYRGGASFRGFIKQIRNDAIAALTPEEKSALGSLLTASIEPTAQVATLPNRPVVKEWGLDELVALAADNLKRRNFERGRAMFGAASCSACHRFNDEGGAIGPDLSAVSGRFSPRDLLESIVDPSKVVSDQYQAVNFSLVDGRVVTGRIMNLHGDTITVNTNMLDPSAQVGIDRKQVEEMVPSKVSMMPKGLLNTLDRDEVLDLLAYLLSRGDPKNPLFH